MRATLAQRAIDEVLGCAGESHLHPERGVGPAGHAAVGIEPAGVNRDAPTQQRNQRRKLSTPKRTGRDMDAGPASRRGLTRCVMTSRPSASMPAAVAEHAIDARIVVEHRALQGQFIRREQVICIEEIHILARGQCQPRVARGADAPVVLTNHANTRVAPGGRLRDRTRTIGRAVVHDDHFQIAGGLIQTRTNRTGEPAFGVVAGNDDAESHRRSVEEAQPKPRDGADGVGVGEMPPRPRTPATRPRVRLRLERPGRRATHEARRARRHRPPRPSRATLRPYAMPSARSRRRARARQVEREGAAGRPRS